MAGYEPWNIDYSDPIQFHRMRAARAAREVDGSMRIAEKYLDAARAESATARSIADEKDEAPQRAGNQMGNIGVALIIIFCTPLGWVGMSIFYIGLYQALH